MKLNAMERSHYMQSLMRWYTNKVNYKNFLQSQLADSLLDLAVLNANLQATQDYVAQVYPGRVTLFRCSVQQPQYSHDPQLGWGSLVSGELESHIIPGEHNRMFKEPRVQALAEKLQLCLAKAQKELSIPQVLSKDNFGEKS